MLSTKFGKILEKSIKHYFPKLFSSKAGRNLDPNNGWGPSFKIKQFTQDPEALYEETREERKRKSRKKLVKEKKQIIESTKKAGVKFKGIVDQLFDNKMDSELDNMIEKRLSEGANEFNLIDELLGNTPSPQEKDSKMAEQIITKQNPFNDEQITQKLGVNPNEAKQFKQKMEDMQKVLLQAQKDKKGNGIDFSQMRDSQLREFDAEDMDSQYTGISKKRKIGKKKKDVLNEYNDDIIMRDPQIDQNFHHFPSEEMSLQKMELIKSKRKRIQKLKKAFEENEGFLENRKQLEQDILKDMEEARKVNNLAHGISENFPEIIELENNKDFRTNMESSLEGRVKSQLLKYYEDVPMDLSELKHMYYQIKREEKALQKAIEIFERVQKRKEEKKYYQKHKLPTLADEFPYDKSKKEEKELDFEPAKYRRDRLIIEQYGIDFLQFYNRHSRNIKESLQEVLNSDKMRQTYGVTLQFPIIIKNIHINKACTLVHVWFSSISSSLYQHYTSSMNPFQISEDSKNSISQKFMENAIKEREKEFAQKEKEKKRKESEPNFDDEDEEAQELPSTLPEDTHKQYLLHLKKKLNKSSKYVAGLIGQKCRLKRVPEIRFYIDDSDKQMDEFMENYSKMYLNKKKIEKEENLDTIRKMKEMSPENMTEMKKMVNSFNSNDPYEKKVKEQMLKSMNRDVLNKIEKELKDEIEEENLKIPDTSIPFQYSMPSDVTESTKRKTETQIKHLDHKFQKMGILGKNESYAEPMAYDNQEVFEKMRKPGSSIEALGYYGDFYDPEIPDNYSGRKRSKVQFIRDENGRKVRIRNNRDTSGNKIKAKRNSSDSGLKFWNSLKD